MSTVVNIKMSYIEFKFELLNIKMSAVEYKRAPLNIKMSTFEYKCRGLPRDLGRWRFEGVRKNISELVLSQQVKCIPNTAGIYEALWVPLIAFIAVEAPAKLRYLKLKKWIILDCSIPNNTFLGTRLNFGKQHFFLQSYKILDS